MRDRIQTDAMHFENESLKREGEAPAEPLSTEYSVLSTQYSVLSTEYSSARREPRPPDRLRLAWLSPLPPARTGIADYSAEMLTRLTGEFEIDAFIDPRQPPVRSDPARAYGVHAAAEAPVRHRARPYDLFVYHVGNSIHHKYVLPLLWQFPGLVVLHDYYLGGLVGAAIHYQQWPTAIEDELDYEGATELADLVRGGRLGERDIAQEEPLNRRILAAAESVIVHSAWSWQRVRRRAAAPVVQVPLHVAAATGLGTRTQERLRLGLPPHAFLVCTLGLVHAYKRPQSLLRAIALLPEAARAATRLVVVGECSPTFRQELRALARALGIESAVWFVGHVPLEEVPAYARAADVCVQLRYPTRGETSAILMRALAAGAACVVSDHGPMAELPDGAVWKVRTPDFEVEDLVRCLTRLHAEPATRVMLGQSARRLVDERLQIGQSARRYAWAIQQTVLRRGA